MSTLYTLIIPKARKFESLKIVQLQASGTFNAPYFHYVICTRTCTNTLKTYPFVSVLVYEYDSSVLQNFKILQLFLDFPLYIFSSAFSNVFLMRCVLITLHVRLYFSHLWFVISDSTSKFGYIKNRDKSRFRILRNEENTLIVDLTQIITRSVS